MGDGVLRTALQQASAAFLHKPYPPEKLARKVHQILDAASEG